jgi:hypothetical protein
MSLKPIREELEVNVDYVCPWTQERGGILSFGSASGINIVEYAADPSGRRPLGVQLNDIEHVNLSREYHPQRIRNIDLPFGTAGTATEGDFETDWIHLVGTVSPGDTAYVGPSGTFTNSSAFGSASVGRFVGPLKSDPHTVTYRGLGFSRQFIDPTTKLPVWENNPADRILIATPGFIKVHINQRSILNSQ